MKRIGIAAFALVASVHQLFRRSSRSAMYISIGVAAVFGIASSAPSAALFAQIASGPTDAAATAAQTAKKKQPLDLALRSIAVLEWTGPAGKPTSSLLIPVAIYTDDRFIDGDDYLADPVPLPVQSGTQYILQRSGVAQGTYDLDAAGKLRGNWFGSGTWQALHVPNPYAGAANSSMGTRPAQNAGDPDRPHFTSQGDIGSDGEKLPTLHLRPPKNAPKTPPPDPNRPVMAYGTPPPHVAANFLASQAEVRQQMVAISDSSSRKERDWSYPWANGAAKNAMQQQVELLAQRLVQRSLQDKTKDADDSVAATIAAAAEEARRATPALMSRPKAKAAQAATQKPPPPALPPLSDVDFRCFAFTPAKPPAPQTPTCILTAESSATDSSPASYVAVVAQPDIYGVPQAISQSIGDVSELDTHPRVRLVDVLDAAGDGKGDILFEIDGAKDRQFGIYEMKDGKPKLAYITAKLPF